MTSRMLPMTLALGLLFPAFTSTRSQSVARLRQAGQVFAAIMRTPDKGIPQEVLEGAQCVAIVPGEKNFALGFGGTYGKGVATCRAGRSWSAPMFIQVGGGSWGLQLGGQSTDVVMVFRDHNGLVRLLRDKVKIGAGAAAAAGPVGRHVAAATDASMHAEILTYSRSRGVFAGISLNGDLVQPDQSGDQAIYGRRPWQDILDGKVAAPAAGRRLLAELGRYSATGK